MLKVIARYRNDARGLAYAVGNVLNLDADQEAFLLRDAPGCFEVIEDRPKRKPRRKPPADKAVSAAEVNK